jgi:hypothetical protein
LRIDFDHGNPVDLLGRQHVIEIPALDDHQRLFDLKRQSLNLRHCRLEI